MESLVNAEHVKPPTLGQRINMLRGVRKNQAQEMLLAVKSAEAVARGPNKERSVHWCFECRNREAALDEFLRENGA